MDTTDPRQPAPVPAPLPFAVSTGLESHDEHDVDLDDDLNESGAIYRVGLHANPKPPPGEDPPGPSMPTRGG